MFFNSITPRLSVIVAAGYHGLVLLASWLTDRRWSKIEGGGGGRIRAAQNWELILFLWSLCCFMAHQYIRIVLAVQKSQQHQQEHFKRQIITAPREWVCERIIDTHASPAWTTTTSHVNNSGKGSNIGLFVTKPKSGDKPNYIITEVSLLHFTFI